MWRVAIQSLLDLSSRSRTGCTTLTLSWNVVTEESVLDPLCSLNSSKQCWAMSIPDLHLWLEAHWLDHERKSIDLDDEKWCLPPPLLSVEWACNVQSVQSEHKSETRSSSCPLSPQGCQTLDQTWASVSEKRKLKIRLRNECLSSNKFQSCNVYTHDILRRHRETQSLFLKMLRRCPDQPNETV